ncbi:uncharacterized protein LOC101887372 [Musca domestica]|uniref:Uncharacterized protein LOC101887372 n=1 Tax=Musca domestica TaxID=7370 RepID=A0A9J7DFU7_MUSDO|nr:uncharacterized protein LOC101887372 [Musca domestica]
MGYHEKRKNVIFIIILTLQNVSTMQLYEILQHNVALAQAEQELWLKLLRQIDQEENFEIALVVGEMKKDFLEILLELQLDKSVLINEDFDEDFNMDSMNSKFITIAVLPMTMEISEFTESLANKLDLRRNNPVIVILEQHRGNVEQNDIELLFRQFIFYKMLNVLVLLQDFAMTQMLYTFKVFPEFKLQIQKLENFENLLPSKMDNVYGKVLRTIPDQVMPRSVVYTDECGKLQVTGYIAQFIRMFARYINSTLKFPDDMIPGNTLFYRDFVNWTQMELLDLPCSITPLMSGETVSRMSYTYEVLSWCLMIPEEDPLTYQDFLKGFLTLQMLVGIFVMDVIFTTLLTLSQQLMYYRKYHTFDVEISNILINPQVILAHLGSSFKLNAYPGLSLRIIYVALFVSGLLYTTAFSVQLNAFLTRPTVQSITSLEDMLKYRITILTAKNEYTTLMKLSGDHFIPYLSLFKVIESYTEFADMRTAFNRSYAYPVTSSVWHVYATRQKLFSQPMFRRTDACFKSLDLMAFVLPRNSIYKQKLDILIARVSDMGLISFWLKNNFYDLVKIGKFSFEDLSKSEAVTSYIKMEDFYYVVTSLIKAFSFSFIVFVMELSWFYGSVIVRIKFCKVRIKDEIE